MNLFETSVKETIDRYTMIMSGEKVIVGLSGGADSISLINVLKKLDYDVIAVHINHMIRGEEAQRDENFVISFCNKNNIPLKVYRKNIPLIAKESGISEELAGRNIRYLCFEDALNEFKAKKIAVAHNMDDNLETMLFNLVRGSGIKGLCGIPPVNGNIIRPLIDIQRCDIESYLKQCGISFITDSTNKENVYSRNIIRNCIVPHFSKINSSYVKNAKRCSDILRDENAYIQKMTDKYIEKNCFFSSENVKIHIDPNEDAVILRRVIVDCINRLTFYDGELSYKNVSDILSLSTGKIFNIGDNISINNSYGELIISKSGQNTPYYEYFVPKENFSLKIKETSETLNFEIISHSDSINYSQENTSFLDIDKLGKLTVRNRREGDRFIPTGMNKEKKLKDFFIDSKIPVSLRNKLPILCSDGIIAALTGTRTGELFKVDQQTKNILKITRGTKDEN